MTWIITSDLHLTDRPEHAYRLNFLAWLATQVAQSDLVTDLFILGDITDSKDHHSARLVNAVAASVIRIAQHVTVHILFGNHDGPSPDRPYWQFLGALHAPHRINYYVETEMSVVGEGSGRKTPAYRVVFSPWGGESRAIELARQHAVDYMFMHATVSGAQVENGMVINSEGLCPNRFLPPGSTTVVFSGDVHVPQTVGDVQYVGAPYHVHYGDPFAGRVLVLDPSTGDQADLYFPDAPRLHSLDLSIDNPALPQRIRKGDRVKINATADRTLLPADWQTYVKTVRDRVEQLGAELTTATLVKAASPKTPAPSRRRSDESIVRTYAARRQTSDAVTVVGVEMVKAQT